MKRLLLIMNPCAGKGGAKHFLFDLCNGLCAQQFHVEVCITQRKQHACDYIMEHGDTYDQIVCLGGDGTWNEVITGTMHLHRKPILAYLPTGTVNDFANTLNLSKDPIKVLEAIEKSKPEPIDIGQFNQRYFTYVAAFGMFTEISYSTPQSNKNILGKVAYFLEGIKQLAHITYYSLQLQTSMQNIEGDFIFGCITNTRYLGGFQSLTKDYAHLDDGLFEVLLIKMPNNLLDLQIIIASLLKREINTDWMIFLKTNYIKIDSTSSIPWTLDGEDGGSFTNAVIENRMHAVQIIK